MSAATSIQTSTNTTGRMDARLAALKSRENAKRSIPDLPRRPSMLQEALAGRGVLIRRELEEAAQARVDCWAESYHVETPLEYDLVALGANSMSLLNQAWFDLEILRARAADKAVASWEADRVLETEQLARKLPKAPATTVAKLNGTLHGAEWLLTRWDYLARRLDSGRNWTPPQRQLALDLLAVPPEFRDGDNPLDLLADDEAAQIDRRLEIACWEMHRLQTAIDDHLIERDADDRAMVAARSACSLDPDVAKLERQERSLAHRMRCALAELRRLKLKAAPCETNPTEEPARPEEPRPQIPPTPPTREALAKVEAALHPLPSEEGRRLAAEAQGMFGLVSPETRHAMISSILRVDAEHPYLSEEERREGRETLAMLEEAMTRPIDAQPPQIA